MRSWLLTKTEMLCAALDHLGIEHENGLTESDDVEKIGKLSAKELKALVKVLEDVASKDEIGIYLKFMGAEDVDKVL